VPSTAEERPPEISDHGPIWSERPAAIAGENFGENPAAFFSRWHSAARGPA
jgi:hypothetical protein